MRLPNVCVGWQIEQFWSNVLFMLTANHFTFQSHDLSWRFDLTCFTLEHLFKKKSSDKLTTRERNLMIKSMQKFIIEILFKSISWLNLIFPTLISVCILTWRVSDCNIEQYGLATDTEFKLLLFVVCLNGGKDSCFSLTLRLTKFWSVLRSFFLALHCWSINFSFVLLWLFLSLRVKENNKAIAELKAL